MTLSGGQKQRVQLARALYADAGADTASLYKLTLIVNSNIVLLIIWGFLLILKPKLLKGFNKSICFLCLQSLAHMITHTHTHTHALYTKMLLELKPGADVYLLDDPLSAVDAHTGATLLRDLVRPQPVENFKDPFRTPVEF